MRRLRTSLQRTGAGEMGVSHLEKVESLPVKNDDKGDAGAGGDELSREMMSGVMQDTFFEARRQVYLEAQAFKHSALYTQKVRLERRLDEHDLLKVQLEALEYQDRNGVLLTEGDFYYRFPQCFDPSSKPLQEDAPPPPSLPNIRTQRADAIGLTAATTQSMLDDARGTWSRWLQRQRWRGWFPSSTLWYFTLFGAVVGAGNFGAYWEELQIWKSSMFIIPYVFYLCTVGLPILQLELMLGNLLRGAAVKQYSQLSPYITGLGLVVFLSALMTVILIALVSGQLLLYFLSSFAHPQPWQVTLGDFESCNKYAGDATACDNAEHGVLCSYIVDNQTCIPSPSGKATLYYLNLLLPHVVDVNINPDALAYKLLISMAFVWLYILAYVWRGLFKVGFLSAVLMIVAIVLCVTLAVVSFFVGGDGGKHVLSAISQTFDASELLLSLFNASQSTALIRALCHDLCVGCCIMGTVASYTKIGYNTSTGALFTCVVDFGMAIIPFISLLAIVGNVQAVTKIPLEDIIRKTHGAPAYFVIFPAAFEKVSSPNLFGLFFYGGIFVINTQVAAIAIHSVFNIIIECRLVDHRWRRCWGTVLVVICYCLSIPFCRNNQSARMDYFAYVVQSFIIPGTIFIQCIVVGWVLHFSDQFRVVGRKASILFVGLCLIFGCFYVIIVVSKKNTYFLPNWLMVFVDAIIAVVIAVFLKDPEAQGKSFKERFMALYFGSIINLEREATRVTLLSPSGSTSMRSAFGCLPTLLCGCLSRPFFLLRPSLYWCLCVKHLIPFIMLLIVTQSAKGFGDIWNSALWSSETPRNVGAALLAFSVFVLIATPFVPKFRDWIRPVNEDYMPTSFFPTHVFKPWKRVSLFQLIRSLFMEHLHSSSMPSASVKALMLDYKKQQLLLQPSNAGDEFAGRIHPERPTGPPESNRPSFAETARPQNITFFSLPSDSRKKNKESSSADNRSLWERFQVTAKRKPAPVQ